MNLILLGAPGSGKGTYSNILTKEFNFIHISTGDIVRNNIDNQTEFGFKAKKYSEEGILVPNSLIIVMVEDYLKNQINKKNKDIVWDGFPRTIEQVIQLEKLLRKINNKVDLVVYLYLPKKELIERIKHRVVCTKCKASFNLKLKPPKKSGYCDFDNGLLFKRKDDTEEKLIIRLKEFENQTVPLIKYYKEKNNLIVIDEKNTNINNVLKKIKDFKRNDHN